ncbi:MAG TPA: hypothetical protein VFD70_19430 [Anaerolineae bacterium]|nr:hypothetical protein [Anaerolineae bacterium]
MVLLILLGTVLGIGLYFFRTQVSAVLPASIALQATATRTPTQTHIPVTVIRVATRPPSTATFLPTHTATPRPPTDTPIPTSSPTATRTVTRTPPRTPGKTLVPTRIPTTVPVPAPSLVSPKDGERILGANKRITLTFQPAQPIGAEQWYRVQVDYLDRAGQPVSWCSFSKFTTFPFPPEIFDDSSPLVRSFLWRVSVVHSSLPEPATCDAQYEPLSAPSDVRTFYWQ